MIDNVVTRCRVDGHVAPGRCNWLSRHQGLEQRSRTLPLFRSPFNAEWGYRFRVALIVPVPTAGKTGESS
jgi:hypothetical protein